MVIIFPFGLSKCYLSRKNNFFTMMFFSVSKEIQTPRYTLVLFVPE